MVEKFEKKKILSVGLIQKKHPRIIRFNPWSKNFFNISKRIIENNIKRKKEGK